MPAMRLQTPEQNYLQEVFPLNDPDLLKIKERLQQQDLDFMSVSGPEARVLQFFIRALNLSQVVEVGTLFGYSAVAMAQALPAGGRVISLEKSEDNFKVAKELVAASSVASKIELICGDALDSLSAIEGRGPFDLVFIDANKGAYVDYLSWAEKNVRSGGLIIGDNTFLFGGVYGASRDPAVGPKQIRVMQEFNSRLADRSKYNSIMIPSFEGMTVAQKL